MPSFGHGATALRIAHLLTGYLERNPLGMALGPDDTLDGGDLLPGFDVPVAELFV
jgi:hypothetical protein